MAPNLPRSASALSFHGRLLLIIAFSLTPLLAFAQAPAPPWWTTYGVLSGGTPNDYAVANQGEAKNIALAAVRELDNDLAQFGGSGLDGLTTTVLSGTSPQESDYAAIDLGQLKFLSKPFFDRLLSLGYTGGPLTSGTYPWAASGAGQPNDYAVGNIGQLKFLFSFNVTTCSGTDGLPDWWVEKYYGVSNGQPAALDPNAFVAWSGSQVTVLQAYEDGLNPRDYYNGQTPTLTCVSGNGQTGAPGGFVSAPLIVSVSGTAGPLAGAPVTFTASTGTLWKTNLQVLSTPATILADSNGQVKAYFQLPGTPLSTGTITAAAGGAGGQAHVIFTESSDNGNTGVTHRSPFSPSNVIGTINADGSEDMTWQNNTDPSDQTPIPISYWNPTTQAWFQIDSVAPGTTSYHIRPNPTPMQ